MPDVVQVPVHLRVKAGGKQRDAVFPALSRSNRQDLLLEVEIPDSQVHAFVQPKPGCIDDAGHQVVGSGQLIDQAPDLLGCQDNREQLGPPGSDCLCQPFDRNMQDVAAEEQQGVEGLLLGGSRYSAFYGQVTQIVAYMGSSDLLLVDGFDMVQESSDPTEIGLFGPVGLVLQAHQQTGFTEEFLRACFSAAG